MAVTETYIALAPLEVGISPTETRHVLPGEEVPEAATWSPAAIHAWSRSGKLMVIPDVAAIRERARADAAERAKAEKVVEDARQATYDAEAKENERYLRIAEEESAAREGQEERIRRAAVEQDYGGGGEPKGGGVPAETEGEAARAETERLDKQGKEQDRRVAAILEDEEKERREIRQRSLRDAERIERDRLRAVAAGETPPDEGTAYVGIPTVDPEVEREHARRVAEIQEDEAEEGKGPRRLSERRRAERKQVEVAAKTSAGDEFREEGGELSPKDAKEQPQRGPEVHREVEARTAGLTPPNEPAGAGTSGTASPTPRPRRARRGSQRSQKQE